MRDHEKQEVAFIVTIVAILAFMFGFITASYVL